MAVAAPIEQRGRGRSPRGAADIVLADETLRFVFLLGHAQSSDPAALTDERASRFLLWFASEGWRNHPHVVFTPDYLAFLSARTPPCASRLAAYALVTRPELRRRFGSDIDRFHEWYYGGGADELGLAPFVSAHEQERLASGHRADARASTAGASHLPGVNIFGFGDSVMGIGEDARALALALRRAGVPCVLINLAAPAGGSVNAARRADAPISDKPIFSVNIFAAPPFETARLRVERGPAVFHGRYSIGYWPWELTSLPAHWRGVFDLVDEVWAASDFLVDVYRRLTDKPVTLMPPHVGVGAVEPVDLAEHGVAAGDHVFLAMLDFNSFVARKNPQGALAAFQAAFPAIGPEKLVIKTINARAHPDAARDLAALAAGEPRCVIIDRVLTRAQTLGLVRQSACFVSLHRAEGFGRVIAEAMALGTPVVATDWSGSTSFLDATRGYPVAFALRDIAAGEYPFRHGSQWAEPSIADAAAKLRRARDRAGRDADMRARAGAFIRDRYGLDPVAGALAARLGAIALSSATAQ